MNTGKGLSVAGHRRLRLFVALMIALYGVIAVTGGMRSPYGEYFPVFNWSLFSNVSPLRSTPEIRVYRIGDKLFERPADYFTLVAYFDSARRRSADVRKNLDKYVVAVAMGRPDEAEKWRRLIESRHLSGYGVVQYEISLVTFSPVERWKTGQIRQRLILEQSETSP